MPAVLPVISAVSGIAGAVQSINNPAKTGADLQQEQIDLEKAKFDYQKQLDNQALNRRIESANRYWKNYNNTNAPTTQESIDQATQQFGTLYDQKMQDALNNIASQNMSRGLYGQAIGDKLALDVAAKVQEDKNNAIGQLANQIYQQGQANKQNAMNFGISTFGTYGKVNPLNNPNASAAVAGGSLMDALDKYGYTDTFSPNPNNKIPGVYTTSTRGYSGANGYGGA